MRYPALQSPPFVFTRISGRYAPFILALAEGSVVRTQGLASLANPTLSFSFISHVFSCMADIVIYWYSGYIKMWYQVTMLALPAELMSPQQSEQD